MLKKYHLYFFCSLVFLQQATPAAAQYKDIVIAGQAQLDDYKRSIAVLQQNNKTAQLAAHLKAIADYHYIKSQSDSAISYYTLAFKQYELVKDSFGIASCSHRIGSYLSYWGMNLSDALFWLQPAALWFERNDKHVLAAHSNYDIAVAYKNAGQNKEQEYYENKAGELNKIAKDTLLGIIIHSGRGVRLRKEGNHSAAIAETKQSLELAYAAGYPFFQKIALINLADDYLFLNQLREAEKALKEAATISNRGVDKEESLWNTLLYVKQGNNKAAELWLLRYKYLTDSIINTKDKQKYTEQIARFETEKQRAAVQMLLMENKLKTEIASRRKKFIYTLAGSLLLILGAGFFIIRNIKKQKDLQLQLSKQREQFEKELAQENEQKLTAEFNAQLAEVQLTALNAQMNPHFIFNCMNSIQKFVLKNEKEKALLFLQDFSELMRMVLHNSNRRFVALDEEIKILDKYISLEQQRLSEHFSYTLEVEPALQSDFFEVPSMVIQPYVENAIWHGLMNKPEKGKLTVSFSLADDTIKCVVHDDGIGRKKAAEMKQQQSPKKMSYGMAIAEKRLLLLHKEKVALPIIEVKDLVDLNGNATGTLVTILFPHS
jgi:Histidine kinase